MQHSHKITIDENVCNGKPTIAGKRIAVQTVIEFLSAGNSVEEILENYPTLDRTDVLACLDFSKK
jgi:uncharacterized protein (DUF433 family)